MVFTFVVITGYETYSTGHDRSRHYTLLIILHYRSPVTDYGKIILNYNYQEEADSSVFFLLYQRSSTIFIFLKFLNFLTELLNSAATFRNCR